MTNFQTIQTKLEQFIKRFYINELLKGLILFFAFGLLYFLLTLFVEYVLWLGTTARSILFWLFVLVEVGLFVRFIAFPVAKLLKLQKGIDYKMASKIIGNHFPEVSDKLLNVLQLNESKAQSELLLASIEQKSGELTPIPFKLAINFKKNAKYLKYAAIPIIILLLSYVTGKINWFSDSYERVVNYKTAYEPPAPFQFFVVNADLNVVEGNDFKLMVKTAGEVTPENVKIVYDDETYFLQNTGAGEFEYVFSKPTSNITFRLNANDVVSKPYNLAVTKAPVVTGFEMVLDYPAYTQKRDETLKGTGNAMVPQGTNIIWKVSTSATDEVFLYAKDTLPFKKTGDTFSTEKKLFSNLDYAVSTNNQYLKDYENLAFSIDVVKDEYPEIQVQHEIDSTDHKTLYFHGQVSDDYALTKLQLVYYPASVPDNKTVVPMDVHNTNFDEFYVTFPQDLKLVEGESYELYFQVFDNDAVNGSKNTKSRNFVYRKLTKEEELNQNLKQQNETIQDLDKSLDNFEKQEKELEELSRTQKEKDQLNFNDKKKLENLFKRQEQQEQMMQKFNQEMQKNLEEFQHEHVDDPMKEQLQDRLKENEQQLQQDEKLLKELQELQEKINKEEFAEKLEQLAKQNKNQKRSLEQLLELTKRYYVGKKLEKLQQDLEQLAEKQESLSQKDDATNNSEEQEKLNKEFEKFQEELSNLEKENKDLKEPLEIPRDQLDEQEVEDLMKEATEELEKNEENSGQQNESKENAQQNQKKAARKMQQMAQQMQQAMQMEGGEQLSEDAAMLRQILDNLVLFSFNQEDLMNQFKQIDINHNEYANKLKKQYSLREHFEHIDDSLFALSLRQPLISEMVNKEITNVYFNIDKSLDQISENMLYQGVAAQQYTITSANNLADFLSNILDNMQMQMNGSGTGTSGMPSPGKQGQGGEMQLPDIIMSQEQLNKQMDEGMKKQGEKNEGENGEKGDKPNSGENKGDQQGEGQQQGGQGEGNQFNEDLNGELYEIYKQQQQLRQALQDRLDKQGQGGTGQNLLKQMEDIETDLLNKGFTQRTLQKMQALKHQLLKLENASFQQGQEEKRESRTNNEEFDNPVKLDNDKAKQYFNTTEILNKQTLPLQPVYKKKAQEYFKQDAN
ncbi:MAG TPA: hypothetical protein P5264_00105 [Mangrovimonas sp.]|nr:hypothetical protein [Mangrovimonas sp.]